jgi:hypothetical protein
MRVVGILVRSPDAPARSAGELRGNTGGADRRLSLELGLLVELDGADQAWTGDATITTGMTSPAPTRVLVVAHQTAATPRLLDEVRARARRSPCTFTLVVPRPYWDPETDAAAATLELAIPLLREAAGGHVEGIVGDSDPFVAVQQAVERGGFDEIIISTLPARVSRWLRRDLPHRVEALGLPVTVVTAQQSERAVSDAR